MSAIADTGLLVALLYERDEHHTWAVGQVKHLRPPLLTCEAVLTETAYLIGEKGIPAHYASRLIQKGAVRVAFDLEQEIGSVHRLLEQYADRPMDFADACIVRMSELFPSADVLTLDSDFRFYQRNRNQEIPVIMPPGR